MNIEFDSQTLRVGRYASKNHLKELDPSVYDKVKDSVFKEFDPMWASAAENFPGTVIHGDVEVREENVRRIYDQLEDPGRFLIFAGNIKVLKGGFAIEDTDRFVILGNLETSGVANSCGELYVEGSTRITGTLLFDSSDGGFTKLRLSEPVGFVAATANVFDIHPLEAKYFFDPSFQCGFDSAPTNRHEEIVQQAFINKPRLVSLELLAAFFKEKVGDESIVAEVLNDQHWTWIHMIIRKFNSSAFAAFFDEVWEE